MSLSLRSFLVGASKLALLIRHLALLTLVIDCFISSCLTQVNNIVATESDCSLQILRLFNENKNCKREEKPSIQRKVSNVMKLGYDTTICDVRKPEKRRQDSLRIDKA